MKITGTLINYYFHCKRQCWLLGNRINLEENSEDVKIGRLLHELKEEKTKYKEIAIENIKIDKLTREYLVEVKKSDADIEAVKWQVLLYLNKLKEKGIVRKGQIEFIEKNKTYIKIVFVDLSEVSEEQLISIEIEIVN
ncbi:Dna2/Cas4 domain-containing protein [Clostridioides difficile]|uniref:Dna2/Cas4 domain-containing protein n=1 Tax=Clostridioides difficile TaxID=1496 RepID=UPI002F4201B0